MSQSSDLLHRYIWLSNTLLRYPDGLTLHEIDDMWQHVPSSNGAHFHRTTFNRDREAISELLGIQIQCNRSTYCYYIANTTDIRGNNISSWMLGTLAVGNVLQNSAGLSNRILLEKIPSGQQYLQTIINAMHDNRWLDVDYQKAYLYPQQFLLAPYGLKVFRQRWYLLAQNKAYAKGELRVYALDRFTRIEAKDETFRFPESLDVETWFADDYGVFVDDTQPVEEVVIRAYGRLPSYLRALPLHHSQEELLSADGYTDFRYRLRLSYDFRQELLSQAEELEVLSPVSLREQIGAILHKASCRHETSRQE